MCLASRGGQVTVCTSCRWERCLLRQVAQPVANVEHTFCSLDDSFVRCHAMLSALAMHTSLGGVMHARLHTQPRFPFVTGVCCVARWRPWRNRPFLAAARPERRASSMSRRLQRPLAMPWPRRFGFRPAPRDRSADLQCGPASIGAASGTGLLASTSQPPPPLLQQQQQQQEA
jgi:hypothetical protein